MFWPAFLSLTAVGLLGVIVFAATAPQQLLEKLPIESDLRKRLLIAVQPTLVLVIAAAGGSAVANYVGAHSLIVDLARGLDLEEGWASPIAAFLLVGILTGAALYLADRWTKPMWGTGQDTDLIADWKAGNLAPGITYGGITEEVMMRWGVMNLILAGLFAVFGNNDDPSALLTALAIAVSALIFAAGHLPAAFILGKRTSGHVLRVLGLNSVVGILFGWIFWRWNLETAMAAHAGFHIGAAILVGSMRRGGSSYATD